MSTLLYEQKWTLSWVLVFWCSISEKCTVRTLRIENLLKYWSTNQWLCLSWKISVEISWAIRWGFVVAWLFLPSEPVIYCRSLQISDWLFCRQNVAAPHIVCVLSIHLYQVNQIDAIPDKIFGTKWSNPVKLDRKKKVLYLFLGVF